MQIPIIPFRGQKKPWGSVPRINWAHPLTRNLSTYVYDMGGGAVIDLVTGKLGSLVGTTNQASQAISNVGEGWKWVNAGSITAVGQGMAFPNSAARQDNLTNVLPYSFSSGFIRTGTVGNAGDPGNAFAYADGAGLANTPFVAAVSNGNLPVGEFSNANVLTGVSTVAVNVFYTITGVAGTAGELLYFNGKLDASNALTTTFTHTGFKPCINTQNFNPTGTNIGDLWAGFVFYGAAWKNRAITAAEASQINNDPWCFLIYPEDEMFATLVGVSQVITTSEDKYHQDWSHIGRKIIILGTG